MKFKDVSNLFFYKKLKCEFKREKYCKKTNMMCSLMFCPLDIKSDKNRNKVHAEIEYTKTDGTKIHSDICPVDCSPNNLNYKSDDFCYNEFLHKCLDEWLNNSNGTGCFYIKEEGFIIDEVGS